MEYLRLLGSVGADQENDPSDIANTADTLSKLGVERVTRSAQTGSWDDEFERGVRSHQASNGLDVDGVLLPEGPTQRAINASLAIPGCRNPRSRPSPLSSPRRKEREKRCKISVSSSIWRARGWLGARSQRLPKTSRRRLRFLDRAGLSHGGRARASRTGCRLVARRQGLRSLECAEEGADRPRRGNRLLAVAAGCYGGLS